MTRIFKDLRPLLFSEHLHEKITTCSNHVCMSNDVSLFGPLHVDALIKSFLPSRKRVCLWVRNATFPRRSPCSFSLLWHGYVHDLSSREVRPRWSRRPELGKKYVPVVARRLQHTKGGKNLSFGRVPGEQLRKRPRALIE